jgi:hypothetical protein
MPNIYQEGKSQFGPLPGAQGSLWAVGDAKGNPVRSSSGQTCGVVWFGLVWFGLVWLCGPLSASVAWWISNDL